MTLLDTAGPSVADRLADITFEQTVPRAIAHRAAVGEVYVTDSLALGEDDYLFGFQLPRAHFLWSDVDGRHDSFAPGEAARQATFVLVHRHLGIPVGLPFSLHGYTFALTDPDALVDDGSTLQGVIHYRLQDRVSEGSTLGRLRVHGDIWVGGRVAMTVEGEIVFLDKDDYLALRSYQRAHRPLLAAPPAPPAPLDPARVGRRDVRNVVVGEPTDRAGVGEPTDRESVNEPSSDEADPNPAAYPVRVVRDHPCFFDHEYDHVPGPFLVECCRQAGLDAVARAGLAGPGATVVRCTTEFDDFAEFEGPVVCVPVVRGGGNGSPVEVEVGIHQFGKRVAGATFLLQDSPCPA